MTYAYILYKNLGLRVMLKANRLVALQKSQVARKRVIPFTQTTIVAMLHTTFLGGGDVKMGPPD